MKETLEKSIKVLAERSGRQNTDGTEALKLSQAALNLAHVGLVLHQVEWTEESTPNVVVGN